MKLTGFVANELHNVMAEITVRYHAGDLTMIKEIIINSQKTDPVTMALKEALAMEQSKRQGKRPMEEGAAGSFKIMRVDETQLVTFHNTLTTEMGNVYKDSLGKEIIKVQNEVKSALGGMETSFISAMKTYCDEQLSVYKKYEEKLNEVRAEYETKLEEQRKLHKEEMDEKCKEVVKKALEDELGPVIYVKSVADKVAKRTTTEKEYKKIGIIAKDMFENRMKMSPGYTSRQYNSGPMVACEYRNRDYWVVQAAAEMYFQKNGGSKKGKK